MPNSQQYKAYRARGVCVSCCKKHDGRYSMCDSCRQRHNEYQSGRYRDKNPLTLNCVDCGKPIQALKKSKKRCQDCSKRRNNESIATRYKALTPMEKAIQQKKQTERMREKRKANPEQFIAQYAKQQYGISYVELEQLYDKQNGQCAICKKQFQSLTKRDQRRLINIDHCHKDNRVRGLLCGNCNRALGLFRDDIDILLVAIDYLRINKSP